MRRSLAGWMLTILVLGGCGGGSDSGDSAAPAQPPAQQATQNLPPAPAPPGPGKEKPQAVQKEIPVPAAAMTREAAKPGVGAQGRDYAPGPVSTPIAAYFSVKERTAFLLLTQAMNLYKAEKGYFPKTENEFMSQIIKANHLHLPELPPGSRYVYDAEKAAKMSQYDPDDPPLMVEHPQP